MSVAPRKITAVLVDDEPLARDKLRAFLAEEPDVEVVGEARDGREAVEVLDARRPDLVFLDVQMPELDGFDVLANLEPESVPTVVFVTAFDRYALRAFEVHAVDYLLKPFDRERFRAALAQAREVVARRRVAGMEDKLRALLQDREAERPKHPERLVIKAAGRVVLLRIDDVDWIDAAGNYVKIHARGEAYLLRETMSGMEARLAPERFARIHRSTIVNVERIKELQQQFHGDYLVVLESGQRLTLSRSYRNLLQRLTTGTGGRGRETAGTSS